MGRCLEGDPGPKPEGETCASDAECASNRCAMVAGAMRCSRQCDPEAGDCAEGTLCEAGAEAGCGDCVPYDLSTGPRPFGGTWRLRRRHGETGMVVGARGGSQ